MPRGAGRPADGQSVGRAHILECAIELLKRRTPEEMTVLEVAETAGVNRALVRYYFGSLKGLLREATEYLMAQLQERTRRALLQHGTLREQVRKRLVLRARFMREHPHFERLALTEIYHAEDPGALERTTQRGLDLTALLFQGEAASRLDPRFIHLTLVAVSGFVATSQPLLDTLFGTGPQQDQHMDAYLDFVADMLARQIRPDPG